jgi:hypothetical protein
MDAVKRELESAYAELRRRDEIVPFLTKWHTVDELRLLPLPDEMLEQLVQSPDYQNIEPGTGPVWFQIAAGDEGAELVIYRAIADGNFYVLAPDHNGAI